MSHTIGEAARLTGVKAPTIRFYEASGLLPAPPRSRSNRRGFDTEAIKRLRFIRHARDLGFDLEAIRELLGLAARPEAPCADAHRIAREHLDAIGAKIARLTALKLELERIAAAHDAGVAGSCEVIGALADHAGCSHH